MDPNSGWRSCLAAAPDSLQGQLQARGKKWVKTHGEIKAGVYVHDILEGRLDQPDDRGAIGKVLSTTAGNHGELVAVVDFGRGYCTNILESELSVVKVR